MWNSGRVGAWIPFLGAIGLVGGLVWWTQLQPHRAAGPAGEPSGSQPDRENPCAGLVGDTPAQRVDACLERTAAVQPAGAFARELAVLQKSGKTLVIGKAHVEGDAVHLDAALRDQLLGTDEAAAAKVLLDRGIRTVVVTRDLTGALDRDATVLSRVAQHDELEWFNLREVTADTLLYSIRSAAAKMPLSTGNDLLVGLRARLEGRPVPPPTWTPEAVQLMGTMRLQGESLVTRYAAVSEKAGLGAGVLPQALDDLAAAMRREWERHVEVMGVGSLEERLKDIRLEVHVIMERANVAPRSRPQLFDLWEIGVDGVIFKARPGSEDERFAYVPGAEAITRGLHSADDFLQFAVKDDGWPDKRPWEDPETRLDLIRTQHFIERDRGGGTGAVRLVRGMPEVPMAHVTDRNVQSMLIAGGEWWVENQFADGSYEYKYWPEQNRQSDDYNEVRHLLGIRDLADAWRYRHDDRYLTAARRGMDFMLRYVVNDTDPVGNDTFQYKGGNVVLPHPPPGSLLFRYPRATDATGDLPNQKLGTVAVGALAWIAYAQATGDHSYDDQIRRMGKFTLSMLEETGRFKPYYVPENHPYATEHNDIVPGEAALALGRMAQYFGEPDWVSSYPKFLAFYRPWFEERAKRKVAGGRWPAATYTNQDRLDLVQFGPWSVMAAAQYYAITKDPAAAEFGLEVADWMIDSYQWSSGRAPWSDYVGGYYKMPEELPAMQTFCYSEGTAAAYRLATLYAPERAARYEEATREAIRFLEVMQYDELDSYPYARPEKIRGGIKYEMAQGKVRIDYVGHGMSTLSQFLDYRRADPTARFDIADPAVPSAVSWDHASTPEEDDLVARGLPLPAPRDPLATAPALPPLAPAPEHHGSDDGD